MTERRRFKRVRSDFKVLVTVCDASRNNAPVSGSVVGRMADLTPYGTCLILDKIQHETHHVFYMIKDHKNYIISLTYTKNDKDNLVVYGNPVCVWHDNYSTDRSQFKLGIEFFIDRDNDKDMLRRFLSNLAIHQDAGEGWLKKLFKLKRK